MPIITALLSLQTVKWIHNSRHIGYAHIRLNERFIKKLNVVHGRLKGWLRTAADACEEMDIPADLAEEAFNVQLSIGVQDVPLLRLVSA